MSSAVRAHLRTIVAVIATAAIVLPLGWMWWNSRLPATYSSMAMGRADFGGGQQTHLHAGGTDIATLTGPKTGSPAVSVDLTARKETFEVGGTRVAGYTFNHTSPGPVIRAHQGDLVEVRLHNENVTDGVTIHWHGYDVPNAEDGVAGVTQDAVRPGGEFTYRFLAKETGTYWYHSHQVSHAQVKNGLWGVLVVEPRGAHQPDAVAAGHVYGSSVTLNGAVDPPPVAARPGTTVRVRVVNTDSGTLRAWVAGHPYRLLAIDGRDVNAPTLVENKYARVPAGGRVDLEVTVPVDGSGVHVGVGGSKGLTVGGTGPPPRAAEPGEELDLLTYGAPAALPFDPAQAKRVFRYSIGRRPGFVDGRPGLFWSINGHLYPVVPMFVVHDGDIVRMTIENHSGALHPMHLHGHHVLVLSRNGVKASGSPWWTDSLDVNSGEKFEVAFLADNPGVWMDHCHNLPHAEDGLVAHLMYDSVTTPYRLGGTSHNAPE